MNDSKRSKKRKPSKKKYNNLFLGIIAIIVIGIAVFTFLNLGMNENGLTENQKTTAILAIDDDGNIVIPIADITETATYYAYDELNTYIEILAVKASDGTVRTAFNTCQVCYASGKGYYIQRGNDLVCQNCGNKFKMDDVEAAKGGCNPVPIFNELKEITETSIIIPKELFVQAEGIFTNWKN